MNRLNSTKSVYLHQHAQNPVHWWPWSSEAIAEARRLDRIVFVSIGYSTCHWCHVMEHESFEDPEVAKLLNANFVAIKVDREEHPEVDRYYMDALLRMTGQGGWPLNIFATPDGKAIVGGTYFPKKQFLYTLERIQNLWREQRSVMLEQSQKLEESLLEDLSARRPADSLSFDSLLAKSAGWSDRLLDFQSRSFDPVWGGFGGAPKFPRPHLLGALLRSAKNHPAAEKKAAGLHAVDHTLHCMAYGGIHDHLGGGFHRYSTDEEWLAPHFEKMLYDQALLLDAYSEAYSVTQKPIWKSLVADIFKYCCEYLQQPSGLYGAGEDADSEGAEGVFYVWQSAELHEALAKVDPKLRQKFFALYPISENGNWEHTNILRVMPHQAAENFLDADLKGIRDLLLRIRNQRPRPILDSKAIVEWNSFLALALIKGSFSFSADAEFSADLWRAGTKILDIMRAETADDFSKLPRVFYAGGKGESTELQASGTAYLSDTAAFVLAWLYRAQMSGDEEDVSFARRGVDWMLSAFHHDKTWRSTRIAEQVGLPMIEFSDGAIPSAGALLGAVLLRAARLLEEPVYMERFVELMSEAQSEMDRYPSTMSFLLSELDALKAPMIKAPRQNLAEIRKALAEGGRLSSEFFAKTSTTFELCRWLTCFWQGDSVQALLQEVEKERTVPGT